MAVQPLRGFRDFYPEDQFKLNYIKNQISEVCRLFGYEEFEGPSLESFELYASKSSDEIVSEQAFVFDDRGGEKIALRPELTPTLARMVASKQGSLFFPLRWWSFGRFWRYERPQKGRGREFYQWNCDILGDDSIQAEIEILYIIITFLTALGLKPSDVVIEMSDRAFLNDQLKAKGIAEDIFPSIMKYLDKRDKLTEQERPEYAQSLSIDFDIIESILTEQTTSPRLTQIVQQLAQSQLDQWVEPNLAIVRGFNYYTGVVFEVSDRQKQYRALLGGGRYSNLVEQVGGNSVSAVGFGMGDMVLLHFLEEKGLIPAYGGASQVCVIAINDEAVTFAQSVAQALRDNHIATITFSAKGNPGKGLKLADTKQCRYAFVVGSNEVTEQKVMVKDLSSGKQELKTIDEAIKSLHVS